MPKFEPKQIQQELQQDRFWPLYWLYGPERLKAYELIKRIRALAFPTVASASATHRWSLGEERIEGTERSGPEILDAARMIPLGGGRRLLIVNDAHAIEDADALVELLGPPRPLAQTETIVICLSKDLDQRKKLSKSLIQSAAVVSCEAVPEQDRPAWIEYLAKRRNQGLPAEFIQKLALLEPWSLEIIDHEIEKISLAVLGTDGFDPALLTPDRALADTDAFVTEFFGRNLKACAQQVSGIAQAPDIAIPLVGLMAWNVRQLLCVLADERDGTLSAQLNPYAAARIRQWAKRWSLNDVARLQARLSELDFSTKQTAAHPIGLWSTLVQEFCS